MTSGRSSWNDDEAMSTVRPAIPPPRAVRSSEGYLGGVAAGVGEHLGVDPFLVRLAFLVTAPLALGVVLYAALWLVLPLGRTAAESAPGLEAASRQGRRPRPPHRLREAGPLVALGALALGVAGLADAGLGGPVTFWPGAIALVGLVVLWRQADQAQRERWWDSTGRVDLRRVVLGNGGWTAYARITTGVGLLAVALALFAVQSGRLSVARDVALAGVLGVLGLALTLGPWLLRLASELSDERAARVRSQERADVAAHLHDSVLQTLALIQLNAQDPAQVARLARAQERDLRRWLYAEPASAGRSVTTALVEVAAEAEELHGVPVEVVTVGDIEVTEEVRPVLQAAREAVLNAVRHSGAAKVDVYAEVGSAAVEVFVRDRGRGFDPATVPDHRLGVSMSIVDRMQRHGGSASVRSTPAEGTEVRLRLEHAPTAQTAPTAPTGRP